MKVLFIGGTGIISSACSALAIEQGLDLYLLNRGQSSRPTPPGANVLIADINNPNAIQSVLRGHDFDAVVNWIGFVPAQIRRDIDLFRGRVGQYVFISSASAYQTPPSVLPVRESTPLDNPYWEYSRNKIDCENALTEAYRGEKFPVTIVRPSHTYDRTLLPFDYGYTVVDRMLKGKPVCVPGDGTSLWTLTHHRDFAKGFNGLLGHSAALGETFHITNDEWLTWNQIYDIVAARFGVQAQKVYLPSTVIAQIDPPRGHGLLGDKSNSMIFDNSKIKQVVPSFRWDVPFARGAEEIAAHYLSHPELCNANPHEDALEDRLCELAKSILTQS